MNSGGGTIQLSIPTDSMCDLGEATKAAEPPFPHHSPTGLKSTLREVGASVTVPVRRKDPSTAAELRGQQVTVAGSRGPLQAGAQTVQ